MSLPPLYNSFDENDKRQCFFCKDDTDDPILFGDKFIYDNLILHHFCLLFSAGLVQKLNQSQEILGYIEKEIFGEIKRASKLTCYYCKLKGASIGCCRAQCKKSFHLPCAIKNKCLTQFEGQFESFCHLHHAIKRSTVHSNDEPCMVCTEKMMEFHPVTSVELQCCNNRWLHNKCLKNLAYREEDNFVCPNCGNADDFRAQMQSNGIHIPVSTKYEYPNGTGAHALNETFETEGSNNDDNNGNNNNYSDIEADSDGAPEKKRRTHLDFILERVFDNKNQAEEALKAEGGWSKYYKSSSSTSGDRQMYRCNKVKFRGKQCAARIYLMYSSKNDTVQLFRSTAEHDHDQNVNKITDLSDEVRNEIRTMYEYGVTKPKQIHINLLKKDFGQQNENHLNRFLTQLRTEKYGQSNIDMNTLQNWLVENTAVPSINSQPFIVDYQISKREEKPYFRFLVSSLQLLQLAINVNHMCSDGTYKLIWQNFPVLQIGTTDMHRHFHPFGLAVCDSEAGDDYSFIFNAVRKGVKSIYGADLNPTILVSDAAAAIHNGFKRNFGNDSLIIMCMAHVRRNIVSKLPAHIKSLELRAKFLIDFDKLQLSKSNEIFDVAAILFVEKWRGDYPDLMQYFEAEWLVKNRFWYEGAQKLIPSTNNALEAVNRVIKDENTVRVLFDLGRFRVVLFEIIENWSLLYVNGLKEIHYQPEITLEMWTNSYNWAKLNVKMCVNRTSSQILYKIPADPQRTDVDEMSESIDWTTFNQFKEECFSFYTAVFPASLAKENWNEGSCDCYQYFKVYMCVHILGIALRMKFVTAPDEAKTIPIGRKRKRGRPALAKPALVWQTTDDM